MTVIAAFLLLPRLCWSAPGPDAAMLTVKAAYEEAFNKGDLTRLWPYIDDNFRGRMVTGEEVVGRDGIRAYWEKMQKMLARGGPGGSYRVELKPEQTDVSGDRARANGTTVEEVRLGDGQVLRFSSSWDVALAKQGDRWTISRMDSKPDLRDALTAALRGLAWRLWSGPLQLKPLRLQDPDFDKDGGRAASGALPAALGPRPAAKHARPAVPPPPSRS
ncbi:MAG: nuclear transport factor 2 family protein [Elusimicrobia bacterium]|nr:nuclear transport factor 2 family protein [Elusimicrobiota bacterium]